MNNQSNLLLFAGFLGIASLVFLVIAQQGNFIAQLFGLSAIVLAIFYIIVFEKDLIIRGIHQIHSLIHIKPSQLKKQIIAFIKKEGAFFVVSLAIIIILFFSLGINHLGQFMSVDEPKWLNTRVPQLYEALQEGAWENTYINDKPGVLPSMLSGVVYFFQERPAYGNPAIEKFLFGWRLPILIFNAITLFLIYLFTRRLFDKTRALLITGLTALHPAIIGISQIVNPDATVWNTAFLSMLTFFLFLKTNRGRYVFLAGFFLGLALISKYFAAIFYVVYFLAIYLEYLLNKTDRKQFFARFRSFIKIVFFSIATYAFLFPATWLNLKQILLGTVGAKILTPGRTLILLLIALIFIELTVFKGKFTNRIRKKIDIGKLLFKSIAVSVLILFVFLLINIVFGYWFFNPLSPEVSLLSKGSYPLNFAFFHSSYVAFFLLTMPLLLGVVLCFTLPFSHYYKRIKKDELPLLIAFLTIGLFIVGAALGGFIISARYQIILYPLYALIAATAYLTVFRSHKKGVVIFLLIISAIIAFRTAPFYLHYTNSLNVRDTTTMGAWGYGGYELAQIVNSWPNAKNITVWADREGFNEFFIGKKFWRGVHNPFNREADVDYFILSNDGERIFRKAVPAWEKGNRSRYTKVVGTTPIFKYYEEAEPIEKICLHDNPNWCTWIVKVNKIDIHGELYNPASTPTTIIESGEIPLQ